MAQPETINALRKFASCDVGDALVKLGVPNGGYLSGLKMFSPGIMCTKSKLFGPVYTVKMVRDSDKASPTPPKHFVDAIPKDSVVFISQPKGLVSACWGGLMSTRAKVLGAAGVVIDGRFRDLAEHQELDIKLFARDISILGSASFTRSSELNVPVTYCSEPGDAVIIQPGDFLVGDADGVVVVPVEKVEKCVKLCQERYEIDEETRKCLENGEEMGPTIKRLRK
ncbi:ribonuclease E inhibitor RraA/Dimethylmenaquinone methyltransferase [Talaromyces proteolyticus]|uniref:Ribonuclease E inhibitor RraA/Dimethylmenaquinone methyltransferase n=1 Tax=Talaromyces proteolyticus TaxID=1131652 RepID=A0AAD4KZN2_9EURO|nr:ribonuclease E inhibitor RraA/Dimethylmenaquinone methyltransferase [Talaromyces proteolyticus]KAH8704853.1 ribonuclease E inhibitor RraA/Dimethylmenaquinone methyltransferase [Talaromyces proteolyticus]